MEPNRVFVNNSKLLYMSYNYYIKLSLYFYFKEYVIFIKIQYLLYRIALEFDASHSKDVCIIQLIT